MAREGLAGHPGLPPHALEALAEARLGEKRKLDEIDVEEDDDDVDLEDDGLENGKIIIPLIILCVAVITYYENKIQCVSYIVKLFYL